MSSKSAPLESVFSMHQKLNELSNVIGFYRDELKIYQNRLLEVVTKNTGKEVLAQAEHFQNQFILQQEQLDELQHTVNGKKSEVDKLAKESAAGAFRLNEGGLEGELIALEKKHADTKGQFYRYLAQIY